MKLVLVIESATRKATIALGKGTQVLFAAEAPDGNRDLAGLANGGLSEVGASAGDIDLIAVNMGPGGLSSVRCGAAFANALAFSLKKPVLPFNSFELLGFQAQRNSDLPVLCTSKAADAKSFMGLYHQGQLTRLHFGPADKTAAIITEGLDRFAVAGTSRKLVMAAHADRAVDTGLQSAHATHFFAMADPLTAREDAVTDLAQPIDDRSELFTHVGD